MDSASMMVALQDIGSTIDEKRKGTMEMEQLLPNDFPDLPLVALGANESPSARVLARAFQGYVEAQDEHQWWVEARAIAKDREHVSRLAVEEHLVAQGRTKTDAAKLYVLDPHYSHHAELLDACEGAMQRASVNLSVARRRLEAMQVILTCCTQPTVTLATKGAAGEATNG